MPILDDYEVRINHLIILGVWVQGCVAVQEVGVWMRDTPATNRHHNLTIVS